MSVIFLAKLYDRHQDDTYVAFRKLEDAIAKCEEWAKDYKHYEWRIPEWKWEPHWKFYKETTFDDGPRVMVEEIELR